MKTLILALSIMSVILLCSGTPKHEHKDQIHEGNRYDIVNHVGTFKYKGINCYKQEYKIDLKCRECGKKWTEIRIDTMPVKKIKIPKL